MLRGLEERLRLALEGTETGFWEWDVATDTVEWSYNMGPLYGLPRGTQPTASPTSSTGSSTPRTASGSRASSRPPCGT